MNNRGIMKFLVKKWAEDAKLPEKSHHDDAGFDCFVRCFKKPLVKNGKKELIELDVDEYTLKPLERIGCPLGFGTAIPVGFYAAVAPRSGNALWKGLSIVNTPGTIDAGYRNEWMAIIVNLSNEEVTIKKHEKICQFIIRKLPETEMIVVKDLPDSDRGLGGFGSTGVDLKK
ncbi:MAG: dUTP diphosphatase [Promethearchaeota archaeon]|nr:MAG: dUTP diphosphatase [Candidatus Lokiarchaeota archaeon]